MSISGPQKIKILIVDDDTVNRLMLTEFVTLLGYEPVTAPDGFEALEIVEKITVDLALLDVRMPQINGYELLKRLKNMPNYRHLPVIMVTGSANPSAEAECIRQGADDYLPKPFNRVILQARIEGGLVRKRMHDLEEQQKRYVEEQNLRLEQTVAQQVKEISSAQLAVIYAMARLAESRDNDTGAHLLRLQEYCRALSTELLRRGEFKDRITPQYIDAVCEACPLHDIGKVGIPDAILLKPGKLTPEEFEIMKGHSGIGADILREVDQNHPGIKFITLGMEIAGGHHEKWDGSGYPASLAGEDIPLAARLVAVCDVYDALVSRRCYKEPFSHEKSVGIILNGAGASFDPAVVDAFMEVTQEFRRILDSRQDEE